MSRTFRNRRTAPHGWVVRDDGVEYHHTLPTARAYRDAWCANGYDRRALPRCPRHARRITRRESKSARKAWWRRYRNQVRDLMRHERWEDIVPPHRTGGRLTW